MKIYTIEVTTNKRIFHWVAKESTPICTIGNHLEPDETIIDQHILHISERVPNVIGLSN